MNFELSKGNPFYLGWSNKMLLPLVYHQYLTLYLRGRNLRAPLTDFTYDQVMSVIQEEFPTLSAHSIKRGALLHLLQQGAPLEILRIIAKHRSLNTLLTYLDSALVAESLGLPDVARHL